MAFHLDTAHSLPTRFIMEGGAVVGYLYAPSAVYGRWEIWPRTGHPIAFADWPKGRQFQAFLTEADALAFLGIQPEQAAA